MKNKFYRKKIKTNKEDNWVWTYLFRDINDMRNFYKRISPEDTKPELIEGVCVNREYYKADKVKNIKLSNKSKHVGYVLTCLKSAGAGVVGHEFMHAVFFANGISKVKCKKQYPIVIKSMEEEERLLYAFTYAVDDYYKWYWKLKDQKKI